VGERVRYNVGVVSTSRPPTVTAGPDAAVTWMSGIARVANAFAGGTVSGPSATVRALLYSHNFATASVVALNAPNG